MQSDCCRKLGRFKTKTQYDDADELTFEKMCHSVNGKERGTSRQNDYAPKEGGFEPIMLHERNVMSPEEGAAAPAVMRAPLALIGRMPTGTVPKLIH